jgi:hypothetical protein
MSKEYTVKAYCKYVPSLVHTATSTVDNYWNGTKSRTEGCVVTVKANSKLEARRKVCQMLNNHMEHWDVSYEVCCINAPNT